MNVNNNIDINIKEKYLIREVIVISFKKETFF